MNASSDHALALYLAVEHFIVTRFMRGGVNPFFRVLFKLPILTYRLGLGRLIGKRIVLLTTIGRKTGKPRVTALGFGYDAPNDTYYVMAGWGGKSDWLRNASANPRVRVRVGARQFDGIAARVPEAQAVALMCEYARINPRVSQMWSRLGDVPFDDSEEAWRKLARYFPSLSLCPR